MTSQHVCKWRCHKPSGSLWLVVTCRPGLHLASSLAAARIDSRECSSILLTWHESSGFSQSSQGQEGGKALPSTLQPVHMRSLVSPGNGRCVAT
jgi:hypothetical protein